MTLVFFIFILRFDDEGIGTVSKDMWLLTAGFSIVLVYVTITIGHYSMIHHKVFEPVREKTNNLGSDQV